MRIIAAHVIAFRGLEYVYHVTYLNNLSSIQGGGLEAGRNATFSNKTYHSNGRVFVTEEDGVIFWNSRYEDWAGNKSDNPAEDGYIPVTLRFLVSGDEYDEDTLIVDEEGTRDAFSDAFYMEDGYVPPGELEVYDGSNWVDLESVSVDNMQQEAMEAGVIEADEDYETGERVEFLVPDFDVFNPSAYGKL